MRFPGTVLEREILYITTSWKQFLGRCARIETNTSVHHPPWCIESVFRNMANGGVPEQRQNPPTWHSGPEVAFGLRRKGSAHE